VILLKGAQPISYVAQERYVLLARSLFNDKSRSVEICLEAREA
jgi:hypothetical protein